MLPKILTRRQNTRRYTIADKTAHQIFKLVCVKTFMKVTKPIVYSINVLHKCKYDYGKKLIKTKVSRIFLGNFLKKLP